MQPVTEPAEGTLSPSNGAPTDKKGQTSFVYTGLSKTNLCLFDAKRQYRYLLTHRWDMDLPLALWIGLNPSTADEYTLDLTLKKIRGFTQRAGLGGFAIVNLYAWRATDPSDLRHVSDPVGRPKNNGIIAAALETKGIEMVIPCWGSLNPYIGMIPRVNEVLSLVNRPMHCLGLTQDGQPKHPSRLGYDTPLVPFPRQKEAQS